MPTHYKPSTREADRSRPQRGRKRSRSASRSRSRSRSPARESHRRSHHHHRREKPRAVAAVELPFGATALRKSDFHNYKNLFATYLDIQKGIYLEDLSESEAKGRWKSFVRRWNEKAVAEGWYDPITKEKADRAAEEEDGEEPPRREENAQISQKPELEGDGDASSDDSVVGPSLPGRGARDERSRKWRVGPGAPNMQDLELRDEERIEESAAAREEQAYERKLERRQQKELQEELAPRPDAGSHERRLEKRQELTAKLKGYAEEKGGGVVDEVADGDLMGGDEDSIDALKRRKQEVEGKKNERALRKEEILRAKAEERAERVRDYREKEDKTMAMLKELAKQRFG